MPDAAPAKPAAAGKAAPKPAPPAPPAAKRSTYGGYQAPADATPAPAAATAGAQSFTNKGPATYRKSSVVSGTTIAKVDGVPLDPNSVPPEPVLGPSGKPMVPGAPLPEDVWLPADAVTFEHACCKAVRANPDDPNAPTGIPEPYLTWQGPVHARPAVGIMLGAAGLILGLALLDFALSNFVPAWLDYSAMGLGGAVLLYLLVSRMAFGASSRKLKVAGTRHILDEKLERGKLFHARLDTQGTVIPGMLSATITDTLSPGLRPVEEPRLDGQGSIHYKVRPQGRGLLTFAGLTVKTRSPLLWRRESEWRLRTTVEVLPSLTAGSWRAILSGYVPFGLGAPKSLISLYREVEHEVVKDFSLGDRPKDIDWKYFARTGGEKMVIRRRWVDPEVSILMLFDCGASMTIDQAGFRTLDMAIELGEEFATYGLRRNHEVGLLAFDETRVIDHVRPTRKKIQMKALKEHMRFVADHHLAEEGEKPLEVRITGDPENLRMGIANGLKQRSTAGLTILLFSDLQTTPEEIVQQVAKAANSGMKACVLLLPPPRLAPVMPFADKAAQEEEERRSVEHTNRMRELLLGNGVDFQEVHPEDAELSLEKELPPELLANQSE